MKFKATRQQVNFPTRINWLILYKLSIWNVYDYIISKNYFLL